MHHNSYPSSSFPPFPTARGSPPLYMPNSHFSDFQQNTLKVLRSHFHFLKKSTGNFNLIFCRLHKHDETLFVVNFHNFLGTLTTSFEFHQYSIIMDQPDNLGDIWLANDTLNSLLMYLWCFGWERFEKTRANFFFSEHQVFVRENPYRVRF